MHADLHGGSTVVVKNLNSKNVIPSRTLEEAGVMAICYSNAWESKVPCRAWWVHHHQVSKTAPSGEYLTVGSFMIRGKKNYLPLSQLVLGFSFLFRLGDDSIAKHAEQQKIKVLNEQPIVESVAATSETVGKSEDEEDEPSAFPNTKVTIKSEEVQLLESSGTRMKVQKIERKQKQTVQRIANFVKPQQMPTTKTKPGNKKSNKSKKKKNGDWSDDEDGADHAKLKLLRKLKKGDRLLDLQEQLKINEEEANVNEQETEEEKDVDSTANVVSNKEEAENVDIEEIVTSTNVNLQLDESDDEDDVAKGEDVTAEQDQKTTGKSDQLADKEAEEEEEEEEQTEEKKSEEYQRLIGSLTGQPLPDDEMLYLIPVVGPYTSMQNNKFKVKILPGTSKRGKTSKTALHLFSVDKQTNGREKELFRSIRDQDVARNLPNKVKLVAQNLHAVKKKK